MEIYRDFEQTFKLTKDEIIAKVYYEPNANVFLASFMKFIGKYADHTHVVAWVVEGMREFLDTHVKCFSGWDHMPVHFMGSVAYHFQHCLRAACELEDIQIGRIIQKPINNLVRYHFDHNLISVK